MHVAPHLMSLHLRKLSLTSATNILTQDAFPAQPPRVSAEQSITVDGVHHGPHLPTLSLVRPVYAFLTILSIALASDPRGNKPRVRLAASLQLSTPTLARHPRGPLGQ